MSNEKNPLASMLEQYESNNKPKYENTQSKVYDLKNYFNTYIKEGVDSGSKTIRILPTADGSSPFKQMWGHKIKIDGETKTFACLKHEEDKPCPFCETRELLLATKKETDKELAKKYSARLMYVVKVVDRDNEADGVKFWRFAHDFRKEGVFDKIIGLSSAIKKDITNAETGRDLVITINRNQNKVPVVSAIASLDASPLSDDSEKMAKWLSEEEQKRTWRDVYAVKPYSYLEIIVKGGTPVWDKEANSYVDKASVKNPTNDSESEVTFGIENLKAQTVASTSADVAEDEGDDLPF